jgi:hypothetical protein
MKKSALTLLLFLGACTSTSSFAQTTSSRTVPVSMVVSVETKHGGPVPTIHREDVRVLQDQTRLQVTDWVALQGDRAGLQLFVLLDDSSRPDIALQFNDLRQFMSDQPASTAIAVGYMRYGTVDVIQSFTEDHVQAGKALRLPLGSAMSPSPYLSISDLIKGWPEYSGRREIFLISSGIDLLYGGPSDPYLADTIERAQRSGIQIYTIFASALGHSGHSFWRFTWGQNNLAQLADETGAESYFQGYQTPVAFKPFLDEFADRLTHQYRVTFLAIPQGKASYQRVRFQTEVSNAQLVGAARVYVPGVK